MQKTTTKATGFTIVELATVIAMIALLASMLLPALARTKASAQRINCTDNLKRISLAFLSWSASHSDLYPMRVPSASGGYANFVGTRSITASQTTSRGVFGDFMVMSNELQTPHLLICPAENESRVLATTFSGVIPPGSTNVVPFTNDLNTSYFIGVDATLSNPAMFLAGDHNLGADGNLVPLAGFVTAPQVYRPDFKISMGTNFAANQGPGWLDTMHSKRGNIVLGDGSVQQFNRDQMQGALKNSGDNGSGVGGPSFRLAPGATGQDINRLQFP
jgi:prepilin-type processing-associated H-X9-DG protein